MLSILTHDAARLIACLGACLSACAPPQPLGVAPRAGETQLGSKRLVSVLASFDRWDGEYDARGHLTAWVRSSLDENGTVTGSRGHTLEWDGDLLISVSPYYAEDQVVTFEYDDRERISRVRHGILDVTLEYDDDGNLAAILDGDSIRTLTYRPDGQLESVSVDDSVPALLEYDDGRLVTAPRSVLRGAPSDTVGPFEYRGDRLANVDYDEDGTLSALRGDDGEFRWRYEWARTDEPIHVWPTPGSYVFSQIPLPVFFRPDGTSDATLRDRGKVIRLFARLNAYEGE